MTLDSIIQIYTFDIGFHYRYALLVIFIFRVINIGVIILLLTRLVPFMPKTSSHYYPHPVHLYMRWTTHSISGYLLSELPYVKTYTKPHHNTKFFLKILTTTHIIIINILISIYTTVIITSILNEYINQYQPAKKKKQNYHTN